MVHTTFEYFICATALLILIPLCRKKPSLAVFAGIMCSTVLAADISLFFVGIESLGVMSALFVSFEKHSKPASTVYAYNMFASLLFLYGVLNRNSELGAWSILIACLCKSAQFPFSNWLLQATHAHTFVSIFIHCATIVGLGVICLYKFPEIFAPYSQILTATIISGLVSAIVSAVTALFETDVKKIMAMLTISSAGIMYVLCGLKYSNIAILYFTCHAFYKSIIFLIFHYYIQYYNTKDFRKFIHNHGVKVIGTLALLSALGIPPFIGSYAKLTINSLEMSLFCKISIALATLISYIVLIRLYLNCFRTPNIGEKFKFSAVWWLLTVSIPIGYLAYTNTHVDLRWKAIFEEISSIAIAFIIARKLPIKQVNIKLPQISFSWAADTVNYINKIIEKLYFSLAYKNIYKAGSYLAVLQRNDFATHVKWVFCGFIIIVIYTVFYHD